MSFRDGLKTLNTVESYDPIHRVWTPVPPMSTHRHGQSAGGWSEMDLW